MNTLILTHDNPSVYLKSFHKSLVKDFCPTPHDDGYSAKTINPVRNIITEMLGVTKEEAFFYVSYLYNTCLEDLSHRRRIFIHGYSFFDMIKLFSAEEKELVRKLMSITDLYELNLIFTPNEIAKLIENGECFTKTQPLKFRNMFELRESLYSIELGIIEPVREYLNV